MKVGLVTFAADLSGLNPLMDPNMDVVWQQLPEEITDALIAKPVEALLMPLEVVNTDHFVAVFNGAREVQPGLPVILCCWAMGQPYIFAQINATLAPTPELRQTLAQRTLTSRQQRVLADIRAGMTNREIALALGISTSTINRHVEAIFRKLHVRTRAQAAARAID
jgi:DNA-binding NarL/FixJ family response regulator